MAIFVLYVQVSLIKLTLFLHKAKYIEHQMRILFSCNDLLALVINNYTTLGTQHARVFMYIKRYFPLCLYNCRKLNGTMNNDFFSLSVLEIFIKLSMENSNVEH